MPHNRTSFLSLLALAALAACSGGGGSASATGRSAALTFTATVRDPALLADPLVVPLASGQLELSAARFHVGHIELEVHRDGLRGPDHDLRSDDDDEDDGPDSDDDDLGDDDDHGDDHGGDDDDDDDQDDDDRIDEVELPGPFAFDLASGPFVLDQVSVFPGTFDRVDFRYLPTDDAPFAGASIVLEGDFVTDQGRTPFTLRSALFGRSRVAIAGGGITVTENAVVPVELAFDLAAMVGGLDVASAVVDGGEIRIDATHNPALLAAFEAGLAARGCVGAHERDD
jgi:hypothetical protein